jgi:hypothetical protein
MDSFSEGKPARSHHSAFSQILHVVFLVCLKSQPVNRLVVNGRFFGGAGLQYLQAMMYFAQVSSEDILLNQPIHKLSCEECHISWMQLQGQSQHLEQMQ